MDELKRANTGTLVSFEKYGRVLYCNARVSVSGVAEIANRGELSSFIGQRCFHSLEVGKKNT